MINKANDTTMTEIKRFEEGKNYTHGWAGDSEMFTTLKVVKRTAKTITVLDERNGETNTRKIEERNGVEYILPYGRYSMCPFLHADKEEVTEQTEEAQPEIKLEKIVIEWNEGRSSFDGSWFRDWNHFHAVLHIIYDAQMGYNKVKTQFHVEGAEAPIIFRIDVGPAEHDFDPKREYIKDYIEDTLFRAESLQGYTVDF